MLPQTTTERKPMQLYNPSPSYATSDSTPSPYLAYPKSLKLRLLVQFAIRSHDTLGGGHVALAEETLLLRRESTNNRVQNTLVVEENHIAFDPIMRIHVLGRDSRSLKSVNQISCLLQISNDSSIRSVNGLDSGGMDLKSEFAGKRVLPAHWEDLDILLVNRRKLGSWEFELFREHSETIGSGLRR